MTVSYETRSSRDEYYDWIAGRGPHKVSLVTNQTFTLPSGSEHTLKRITGKEGDLRYLLIEITSDTSADSTRLTIESDSFYFSYTMKELMNYNIDSFPDILPSMLVADPSANRYVVVFRPIPPLHFIDKLKISVKNEDASATVNVKYTLAYSEVGD